MLGRAEAAVSTLTDKAAKEMANMVLTANRVCLHNLAQAGRDRVHAKNRVRSATGGLIHSAKKADADQQQRVRQMDRERRLAVGTATQAQAHKDKFLGNGKQQGKYNKLSRKAGNLKRGLRKEQAAKKAEKRGGKGGGGKGGGGNIAIGETVIESSNDSRTVGDSI